MSKKEYIIPLFIPFLGCPHDCAFCNQIKITNYKDTMDKSKLRLEIEKNLSYFKDEEKLKEIAFFGGSFTGLSEEVMVGYLEIAGQYKKKGIIDRIRLSTRPDYINNSILDLLKNYSVDIIELGIQSLDQEVLDNNDRGHSVDDSIYASKLIKEYGFSLGHQIMPGLFTDTFEKSIDTAIKSIKLKPDMVRIYPTLVIKETKLSNLYKAGIYQPLSLDSGVEIASELAILYKYSKIPIIRIGLQPTENINYGKDVIAGPFHPAIRQLVEANIYKKYLEFLIEKYKISDEILIACKDQDISLIAGNKKANKTYFYKKYGINIKFQSMDYEKYLSFAGKKVDFDIDNFINSYVKENYGGDLLLD